MRPKSAVTLEIKWRRRSWYHKPSGAPGELLPLRDALNLRLRRVLSWLGRAEREYRAGSGDLDAAFMFYWVAFNAAYDELGSPKGLLNRTQATQHFRDYFKKIIVCDSGKAICSAVRSDLRFRIQELLENKYVFEPYWRHFHGVTKSTGWKSELESSKKRATLAIKHMCRTNVAAAEKSVDVLSETFDRLYTLRNQLLHGSATWKSSLNRKQVEPGAGLMARLVPYFVEVMIDYPDAGWDAPRYPVVPESGPMSGWPGGE